MHLVLLMTKATCAIWPQVFANSVALLEGDYCIRIYLTGAWNFAG